MAENLELDRTNRADQDVEQEPGFDKRSLGITHRGETAQIPRVPQRPFPKLDDAPVVAASVEEEQIPVESPPPIQTREYRGAKGKDRDPEGTKERGGSLRFLHSHCGFSVWRCQNISVLPARPAGRTLPINRHLVKIGNPLAVTDARMRLLLFWISRVPSA